MNHLDYKPRFYDEFDFCGNIISTLCPGKLFYLNTAMQKAFLCIKSCTYAYFLRDRATLSFLSNSLPNLFCIINRAAQVTNDTMCAEKLS